MKLYFLGIFVLLCNILNSQIKPDFFPEDILTEDFTAKCYCKPGVLNKTRAKGLWLSYGTVRSGNYEGEKSTIFTNPLSSLNNLNHFALKLKVPVLLKERTKILLGYSYFYESYHFNTIGLDFSETFQSLDNDRLKGNGYSLIVSHVLNEKNYLGFRYKYGVNGNYSKWTNFDSRYAIHSFMGLYGIKKTATFEWGIGLLFSSSFRRTSGLPFLLYNRTFNDKWGIESMFPANFFLRYNVGPLAIATFGLEYNSKSYRLDVESTTNGPLDYAFNHSELLLSANLEKHLSSWIWANVKVGYQQNFSSDFEPKSDGTSFFQAEPKNGLYLQIGIFVSPELDHDTAH